MPMSAVSRVLQIRFKTLRFPSREVCKHLLLTPRRHQRIDGEHEAHGTLPNDEERIVQIVLASSPYLRDLSSDNLLHFQKRPRIFLNNLNATRISVEIEAPFTL